MEAAGWKALSSSLHTYSEFAHRCSIAPPGVFCQYRLLKSNGIRARLRVVCSAPSDEDDPMAQPGPPKSKLGAAIKRKQGIIQARLQAIGPAAAEAKLAEVPPVAQRNALIELLAQRAVEGRTAVIAEVARLSPAEAPAGLARRCRQYVEWGADAIAVCCDEEDSPDGTADLAAACRGLGVPVIRKDWILHPLQIAETAEAGAAAIHVVHAVLGRGTAAIVTFAVSLGLDVVVEVINAKEAEEMESLGVPLYGVNLSVGLSLAVPGLRQGIAKSLVESLPFGAASVVGIASIEEARAMKIAGATAVVVKKEALQGRTARDAQELSPRRLLEELSYAMTGDD